MLDLLMLMANNYVNSHSSQHIEVHDTTRWSYCQWNVV